MKKFKKLLTMLLAFTMTASVTACGGGREEVGGNVDIDESMSQLYVSNYEGGFGRVWLDNAAKRFEEKYAETSFEDGKKGVQVIIDSSMSGKTGITLLGGLSTDTNDVFFTEDVFYYDLIANGGAADITDIVTDTLGEWEEDKSIEDKMSAEIEDFYKTSDGKYYALPHYEAYYGIIYDMDLFRLRGLYFAKGGTPGEYSDYVRENNADAPTGSFDGNYKYVPAVGIDEEITAARSTGPDGLYGTYDDGLPATYDEFFALCDKMVRLGITPFTWTGQFAEYSSMALSQLWADYEGRDRIMLNFNLSGTATDLVDRFADPDDPSTAVLMSPVEITDANAYMLQRQLGKQYAVKFGREIGRHNNWATSLSYSASESHVTSEGTFLLSRLEPTKTPIAFTFNGVWWENEADENGYFTSYAKYGETRMSRSFGMLPMPKVDNDHIGEKWTIMTNCNNSQSFINKRLESNPARLKLAKKFLQFVHTDDELQYFSATSSTNKPFNYEIDDEKLTTASPYGRYIANLRNNEKVDMVYAVSSNPAYINNADKFYFDSDFDNTTYSHNVIAEFHNRKDLTCEQFFNALVGYKNANWLTK